MCNTISAESGLVVFASDSPSFSNSFEEIGIEQIICYWEIEIVPAG